MVGIAFSRISPFILSWQLNYSWHRAQGIRVQEASMRKVGKRKGVDILDVQFLSVFT
jgi:hypothetical protein